MKVIDDVRLWAENSLNTCRFYRLSTPTLTSRSGRWRCSVQLLDQFKPAGDNPHEQPVQRGERVVGEHGEQVPQRPRPGGLEGGQAGDQVSKQIKFWRVWKANPLSLKIFRDQLRNLVTRVMNDAFSSLPADQLLNNLVRLDFTIFLLV